jgi:hypothetical protein
MWRIRILNNSEMINSGLSELKIVLCSGIVSLLPRVAARWRTCIVWKGGSQRYRTGPPWSGTVGVYSNQLHVEQLGETHGNTYGDIKACYLEKKFVKIVSVWIVNRVCFTQLQFEWSVDYFITLLNATSLSVFVIQLRYVRRDDYLNLLWFVSLVYHNRACAKPHTYINVGNSYCFTALGFASRVTVILTVVVVTILMCNSNDDHLNAQYVGLCVGITLELAYVCDHGIFLESYMKFDVVLLRWRSLPGLRIPVNETRPNERLESKSMKHVARCSKNLTRLVCSHDGIVPHFQTDTLVGWQRVRGGNAADR